MAKRPTSRNPGRTEASAPAPVAAPIAPVVGFVGPVAPPVIASAVPAPLQIEKAASDEIEARVAERAVAVSAPMAPAIDAAIVATARATLIGTMDDWATAAVAEIQRVVLLLEETRDWTDDELSVCRQALGNIRDAAARFAAELSLPSRVAWLGRIGDALDECGFTEADVLDFNFDTRRIVTTCGRKIEIA